MKLTNPYFAVLLVIAVTSPSAHAQVLPPACEQFAHAYEVCSADYTKFVSLVDPGSLPTVQTQLKQGDLRTAMRGALPRMGAEKLAEKCASPDGKGQLYSSISGLAVAMRLGGGDPGRCMQALGAIR